MPRNDVRPLLRFQISKRPTSAAVVGYGVELGSPEVTVAQQRAALGLGGPTGELLAAVTSVGADDQHRLALTTAFNGDLSTQRPVVVAGTPTAVPPRPGAKSNQQLPPPQPLSVVASKSKSAAAADARQTVQEKNAYEYERVMDILRYYRELVVERKLPGACLPCKRRKSKPLVSADPITTVSARPALHVPLPTSSTAAASRPLAVPAGGQYLRPPAAVTAWRGQTPTAAGMCLPPASSAGKPDAAVSTLSLIHI